MKRQQKRAIVAQVKVLHRRLSGLREITSQPGQSSVSAESRTRHHTNAIQRIHSTNSVGILWSAAIFAGNLDLMEKKPGVTCNLTEGLR